MTNTTYYNLKIVEGSDIVNPLTVDNPNYEIIDETMHGNAVSGVTLAAEIANATVHAITRENSECAVIRFIATSEWKAGDTVTVDGVPVTALLPSGETLPDGAYVINSNVLCILTGTNMTVFAERKKTDTAKDIKYNNTNVGAELDKINSNLNSFIAQYSFDDFSFNDNPVPANTVVKRTINFGKTYKTSPIVLVSLGFTSDNAMYGMLSISATNTTTTSFDLTIFNASNEDKFPIIYYTVIERY